MRLRAWDVKSEPGCSIHSLPDEAGLNVVLWGRPNALVNLRYDRLDIVDVELILVAPFQLRKPGDLVFNRDILGQTQRQDVPGVGVDISIVPSA